jgi:hypothetical protein
MSFTIQETTPRQSPGVNRRGVKRLGRRALHNMNGFREEELVSKAKIDTHIELEPILRDTVVSLVDPVTFDKESPRGQTRHNTRSAYATKIGLTVMRELAELPEHPQPMTAFNAMLSGVEIATHDRVALMKQFSGAGRDVARFYDDHQDAQRTVAEITWDSSASADDLIGSAERAVVITTLRLMTTLEAPLLAGDQPDLGRLGLQSD